MATIFTVNYDGGYGGYYEFKADASESDVSNANNTSKVTVNIYLRRTNSSSNGAYNNYGTDWSITIDGSTYTGNSTWDTRNTTAWQYLGSASKTVEHNTDGSKKVTISAYHTGNSASGSSKMGNASGSGTFTLTTIPRYMDYIYISERSKTINSISVDWSTSHARDWTQYSLNGGSWTDAGDTVASNNKSGYFTISGLSPSTTYSVQIRCRRTDSGLWSSSGSLSITTRSVATISGNNFNLGDNVSVAITQPRRRSYGSNFDIFNRCFYGDLSLCYYYINILYVFS